MIIYWTSEPVSQSQLNVDLVKIALVMMSVHSSKTMTKMGVGTRYWGIYVIGLTMLLFRGMRIWGLWKAAECFKMGLMVYLCRKMENFVAE